eukprot:NODE_147_length_17537_cov_0.265627.p2 type:complete len:472 gc:universal NODE_147_length_17537_cov_0.265627:4449-5864(+)
MNSNYPFISNSNNNPNKRNVLSPFDFDFSHLANNINRSSSAPPTEIIARSKSPNSMADVNPNWRSPSPQPSQLIQQPAATFEDVRTNSILNFALEDLPTRASSTPPHELSYGMRQLNLDKSQFNPKRRSPMLEEFRLHKKKFELHDLKGSFREFATDQHGSRFIQQKLEGASRENQNLVFQELSMDSLQLMTDVFGNYVIQKFFEYGSPEHKSFLVGKMQGHVLQLSLQMYGCRVVQKCLEFVNLDQQLLLVEELRGNVLRCVKDQNGNHVVQKAIEKIPGNKIEFILNSFKGEILSLAMHPYGCRVVQRIFEHCYDDKSKTLFMELHDNCPRLIQDQYGNYVVQHLLERGRKEEKTKIIAYVLPNLLQLSRHKFASNVVEKCVVFGSHDDRKSFLKEVLKETSDGKILAAMMRDQYANYVVQKMLDVFDDDMRNTLLENMKKNIIGLKKVTFGKHLMAKMEKYTSLEGVI